MFVALKYPKNFLILLSKVSALPKTRTKPELSHSTAFFLGKKIDRVLQSVFTSRKISEDFKVTETKPSLYDFNSNSCDANYIGCIGRHLHQSIIEERIYYVISKHLKDEHNRRPNNLYEQFVIVRKRRGKFDCVFY